DLEQAQSAAHDLRAASHSEHAGRGADVEHRPEGHVDAPVDEDHRGAVVLQRVGELLGRGDVDDRASQPADGPERELVGGDGGEAGGQRRPDGSVGRGGPGRDARPSQQIGGAVRRAVRPAGWGGGGGGGSGGDGGRRSEGRSGAGGGGGRSAAAGAGGTRIRRGRSAAPSAVRSGPRGGWEEAARGAAVTAAAAPRAAAPKRGRWRRAMFSMGVSSSVRSAGGFRPTGSRR